MLIASIYYLGCNYVPYFQGTRSPSILLMWRTMSDLDVETFPRLASVAVFAAINLVLSPMGDLNTVLMLLQLTDARTQMNTFSPG